MLDIETIVFSRIKTTLLQKLKTKYPDIAFTTSNRVSSNPKFPNVYVHMMGSQEIGEDLENNTINGISATFQIETTDNQSQSRAKEVMNEVVMCMKTMRFSVVAMPEFDNTDSTFRSVARFRRTIGNLDKI
jgi:hypothetical protein